MTFSPTLISLSAELRHYPMLLLWMAAALYYLEHGLRTSSAKAIVKYSMFLYLAILTHYSAAWFTISLGIYVLIRWPIEKLSRRFIMIWACLQVVAAGIYLVLYETHIAKLRGSALERDVIQRWFHPSISGRASIAL